ncbi:TonB-dependent receptor [Pelagicoccus sp. SDUM812003]|uniref:TonB-dependent receptor n=1 Tax=Pelagicoccus sp. SDUM812003 TaxID=3041267 RepID=UPI00280D3D04|nr:TonB-dependent receptor [Pelagicoccus sp. SDUM812003]MDQ8202908.1 TonB-dependent receptor [Pelagicoccus sp. SDUM812003]
MHTRFASSKTPLAVTRSAAVLSAIGLAFSPTLFAQSKADDVFELDAFEVTGGYAGSLAAATQVKRYKPVIVEAISAEDIGKLPDTSIAESLARLPGLTSQRVNSRAQGIVIRGLTGDFSTALLNGRQQVSTSSDRSVEFDQYPAELLNGVVVYKTADATVIGQGLAGTIDMATVSPLKHGKRTVAANLFYEWSDLGKLNPEADDAGIRYSLNYIDQLDQEGKTGIAFGYVKTDQPGQGEQWNAWGYPIAETEQYGDVYILGGAKPFVRSSTLDRESFLGVLENRPSDSFHSKIDLFYSEFSETQYLRGIEIPLAWSSAEFVDGSEVVEDGLVTEGVYSNVYGVMRNDIVWRDAEVFNAGWNIKLGDESRENWLFTADLSTSQVERKDNVLETYSGFASNQNGTEDIMRFSLKGGAGAVFTPTLDYTDASQIMLASPQGWGSGAVEGGQVGFFKGPEAKDSLDQLKLSVGKNIDRGIFSSFEGGVAYTTRNKWEIEAGPDGTEGFFLALPNGATSAPLPEIIGTTSLSFIGIEGMPSYDARALYESGYYDEIPNDNPAYVSENWEIQEDITTGFVQMGISTSWGDVPVTGFLGAQVIQSEQESSGLATNGVTTFNVTDSHDYTDFVPSLSLNFAVGERSTVRFSVARQLARQEMRDMRAGSTYEFNPSLANSTDPTNSPWKANGGNPKLEPWRSNSIDLTYERYFQDGMGYWAINGFYKDLVSYTFDEPILWDFTGYSTGASDVTPAIYQGYNTVPQNGSGGSLRGLELALSLPGEKLSESLRGFGMTLSGSLTESSIQPDPGNPSQPIPGLSEQVVNGTVYYENQRGFSARLSARYRSEYRGDISTFGPRGETFRSLQPETVVDAQVSYAFQSGALEGMSLILQGYNLTDEPLFATQGDQDDRLVQDYQSWGAQYSVGVAYKF